MAAVIKGDGGKLIDSLLKSDQASIRRRTTVAVVGRDPQSARVKAVEEEIRKSPRAKALLAGRD